MNNTIDYGGILVEAMGLVAEDIVSTLKFDRTIACVITDASKAHKGIYTVQYDNAKFTAYSENQTYKKDDNVYVLVPENDFSNEKTILRKFTTDDNAESIAYVSPLAKIVAMSPDYGTNFTNKSNNVWSIAANDEECLKVKLGEIVIPDNEPTINYDTLCVKADFKCLLQNYDMRQGNYGLLITLTTESTDPDAQAGEQHILFDSAKDMFGNIYGFTAYFTQEQAFQLNFNERITKITIELYQLNNFEYNDGVNLQLQKVPVFKDDRGGKAEAVQNIFVRNISLQFGYNTANVENHTVKINSPNSPTYNKQTKENLTKKLNLTWFNKDENNKYIGFADGDFGTKEDAQAVEKSIYYIEWEHSLNNGKWEVIPKEPSGREEEVSVKVNTQYSTNKYRASVWFQGQQYKSNVLSFASETGLDGEQYNDLNISLELRNKEGHSQDSYPCYGGDGLILSEADARKNRKVQFKYNSESGEELEPEILNGGTAYFYVPKYNTMLDPASDNGYLLDDSAAKEDKVFEEGYYIYKKTFTNEFTRVPADVSRTYNLLTDTEPKELNGRPRGYTHEYKTVSAGNWIAEDTTSDLTAYYSDQGKAFYIVRKKTDANGTNSLGFRQKVSLTPGATYGFSGMFYVPDSKLDNTVEISLDYWGRSNKEWTSTQIFTEQLKGVKEWFTLTIPSFTVPMKPEDVDDYELYFRIKCKAKNRFMCCKPVITYGVGVPSWDYAQGEEADREDLARTFEYRIKDIFNPTALSNTVRIKITDRYGYTYSADKTFAFTQEGAQGTTYTLCIEDLKNQKAVLYDPEKEIVSDQKMTWSMYPTGNGYNYNNRQVGYNVAQVETTISWTNGLPVVLRALRSMPWTSSDDYMFDGQTSFQYDNNGVNPKPSSISARLLNIKTNKLVEDLSWELEYYRWNAGTMERITDLSTISVSEYPQLVQQVDEGAPSLRPAAFYLTPPAAADIAEKRKYCYLVLVAKDAKGASQCRVPIFTTQNQYASSIFNDWGGGLEINHEKNYILSAMMGAGYKESDNSFSGVVMGKLLTDYDSLTPKQTGLFGFQSGVQSFGFNVDGTAFIGRNGLGRINFDGNSGAIASSGWVDEDGQIKNIADPVNYPSGIFMDLKNGSLNLKSASGNYFYFDEKGLDIKVNQLQITNNIGAANLLKMTNPKTVEVKGGTTDSKDNITDPNFWKVWRIGDDMRVRALSKDSDKPFFRVSSGEEGVKEYMEQSIIVEADKYYTLSGYVKHHSQSDKTLKITCTYEDTSNTVSDTFTIGYGNTVWKKFVFIFKAKKEELTINFSAGGTSMDLRELQLEEGTVATAWRPAENDTQVQFEITSDRIYSSVGKSSSKYDTSTIEADLELYGEGEPPASKAASYKNKYYLDFTNGNYYLSDGSKWTFINTLQTVQYNLETSIDQTAEAITLTASAAIEADYVARCTDSSSQKNKNFKRADITYPKLDDSFKVADIVKDGVILALKFTNAAQSEQTDATKIGITGSGFGDRPIYLNGKITSKENPVYWSAGETVYFKCVGNGQTAVWHVYSNSATTAQLKIQADSISSTVSDIGGRTTTIEQNIGGITATAITRTGNGFGFSLSPKNFLVGTADSTTGKITPTLSVVDGKAMINGEIKATSGSIAGFTIGDLGYYPNALAKRTYNSDAKIGYEVGIKATSGIGEAAFYVAKVDPCTGLKDANFNEKSKRSFQFLVRNDGRLTAKNANIEGKISASSGNIGGWEITSKGLVKRDSKGEAKLIINGADALGSSYTVNNTTKKDWVLWMNKNFGVDSNGKLYASGVEISGASTFNGKITATEGGNIGGFKVEYVNLVDYHLDSYATYNGYAFVSPGVDQGLDKINITYPDGKEKLVEVFIKSDVNFTPQGVFLQNKAYEQGVNTPVKSWGKFKSWKDIVGT